MTEPLWPAEDKAILKKHGNKYLTISTKNKTAVFKSVKILYEGFAEWNAKYDNKRSIDSYLAYIIEEAPIRESRVTLKLKFYTYKRLADLKWKPKKGIAFSRYREILTREISSQDRIDLLKRLEDKKQKISAREFRELIKSKRSRASGFAVLKKPIVFENVDDFCVKIKDAISKCAPVPKGALFHVRIDRKTLRPS